MTLRKIYVLLIMCSIAFATHAQQKNDTVKISLAKTSQIIFTMKDKNDLEILKHYDFQSLFSDILTRLEQADTARKPVDTVAVAKTETAPAEEDWNNYSSRGNNNDESGDDDNGDDDGDDDGYEWKSSYRRWGKSWQSFNFDLGTNNFLSNGKFPDSDNALYSVRPWGSWYFAMNSTQRSRLGRNFFLEWGVGLSWYTFKFQNDAAMLVKNDNGVEFVEDIRDVNHIKSKLGMSFINVSLIPVLDFGDHSRKPRLWDSYGSSFRIGLGPYIGYKLSSRTKMVYKEDGDREKDKERDSFYINNLRYGARLQLGFRSTDFFFNYDMNELFASGKGPKLNAFSFGVIF